MSYNRPASSMLDGRRIGLLPMTSAQNWDWQDRARAVDFLVGPEDLRRGVTTAETYRRQRSRMGRSFLNGPRRISSVYVLDPPIPGVRRHRLLLRQHAYDLGRPMRRRFRTSADSRSPR